jgi:hypothetical protein
MRFRASPCAVLPGALLLLVVLSVPLSAAAPPASLIDGRRSWVSNQSLFRFASPGRWVEYGLTGTVVWRENNRQRDYIELYEPTHRQFIRLYPTGQYLYVPAKEHFRWVCPGKWGDGRIKPLDFTRNASNRTQLESVEQRRSFPRLGKRFEVIAPATVTYNCIGWSLGNNSAWVWPRAAGVPCTLEDFDGLYGLYGFKRIAGLDTSRQPGVEKVVVFALRKEGGGAEVTHASRQLPDGSWSSKLGSLPLIRHLKLDDVSGPTYGSPYAVYVKPRAR